MKYVIIALLLALAPLVGFADATVYNCPKHGPCTQDQIIKTGEGMNRATYCKRCFAEKKAQEKKRKEEEAEKERQRRLVSGKTNELGIVSGMVINARCINTNILATRILPAINSIYGKTANGYVQLSTYEGNNAQPLNIEDFKQILLKGGSFIIQLNHRIVPYQKKVGETYMAVKRHRDSLTRMGGGRGIAPVVAVGGHWETINTRIDRVTISLKQGVMVTFDPNFK